MACIIQNRHLDVGEPLWQHLPQPWPRGLSLRPEEEGQNGCGRTRDLRAGREGATAAELLQETAPQEEGEGGGGPDGHHLTLSSFGLLIRGSIC